MKYIITILFLFAFVTFCKAQDSTLYKKFQADLELTIKQYNEISAQKLKFEGIIEYLQFQIAEEKKKFK